MNINAKKEVTDFDIKYILKKLRINFETFDNAAINFNREIKIHQLELGYDLFKEIFEFGQSYEFNIYVVFKSGNVDIKQIANIIIKRQRWIKEFISIYCYRSKSFEFWFPYTKICVIRSGIEYLLLNFKGLSDDLDKALLFIKTIKNFDTDLKYLKQNERVENGRPFWFHESHWWWI